MSDIEPHAGNWEWHHPGGAPRPSQVDIMDWAATTDKSIEVLSAQAPTGVGKSGIAVSVARSLGGGTILTPQNVLLEQYKRDWPDLAEVRGANNYDCNSIKGVSCEVGRAMKCGSMTCGYKADARRFGQAQSAMTNYAWMFRAMKADPCPVPRREWLIMDEFHNIEEAACSSEECIVDQELITKCGITSSTLPDRPMKYQEEAYEFAYQLISRMIPAAEARHTLLRDQIEDAGGRAGSLVVEANKLRDFIGTGNAFLNTDQSEYIAAADSKEIKCRPLFPKRTIRTLRSFGNRMLCMSATPLPKAGMAHWLGLDNVETLDVEHPFDVKNRTVIFWPKAYVKSSDMDNVLPKLAKACSDIMIQNYPNDKGLIHCSSFALGQKLVAAMDPNARRRCLLHTQRDDREEIIKRHMMSKEPCVLVSPSMTEGLDMKDDRSRFCIFPKVPYPYLGDPWVKARLDDDGNWYEYQAIRAVVQGCGRSVRHAQDWADAWILDENFERLMRSPMMPRWFKRSIEK